MRLLSRRFIGNNPTPQQPAQVSCDGVAEEGVATYSRRSIRRQERAETPHLLRAIVEAAEVHVFFLSIL